ncbi:hypothetical protein BX616_009027 [Lobosporangium transversale]|uniref:F-box domain-containing protein n=1 Tax=Lobosporangium transversale TaxID=64571 RepID=A0A1Y2GWK8_9FUNG|nr:hypothetical protein BCR41DRAFT_393267 [Lobosporangium transversale]KAF9914076.1 hypothetical protein BX616_009027 [Lobosporangium transversale]ORZ26657.1 hypothetical protein BCR41DRAFT_393267 [Lobosporangium transversale]|eukprot:XP_021884420.1 hypothetical protein BCR41DRAFT_393267 [Lobosporangium transversale]
MEVENNPSADIHELHPRGSNVWLYVYQAVHPNHSLKCMKNQNRLKFASLNTWKDVKILDFKVLTDPPEDYPNTFGKVKAVYKSCANIIPVMSRHTRRLVMASIASLNELGPACVNLVQFTHIPASWMCYDWRVFSPIDYMDSIIALEPHAAEILSGLIRRNPKLTSVCLQLPAAYNNVLGIVDALGALPYLKTLGISGETGLITDFNHTSSVVHRVIERCQSLKTLVVGGNICGFIPAPTTAAHGPAKENVILNHSLETLDLGGTIPRDCPDLASLIWKCTRLKNLILTSGSTPKMFLDLADTFSLRCTHLSAVTLEYCKLEHESFSKLLESFLRLHHLKLSYCSGFKASMMIGPYGLRSLMYLDTLVFDFDPRDSAGIHEAATMLAVLPGNMDYIKGPYMEWRRPRL